jgi:hypothetical protein
MALKFGESAGEAQKTRPDSYTYKEGRNEVRLVGDLTPRYVYWLKGENNKQIPMECLAFDREQEKFLNQEKDYVKEYHPDLKCGWAYVIQALDVTNDNKLVLLNLKKKLTGQILDLAKELGDPTDPENGWNIIFEKKKTGPLPLNVEYKLKEREIKNSPLTDEQREIVAELKSMDEILPRPTPEQQKEFLERLRTGGATPENIDESVGEEFEVKE